MTVSDTTPRGFDPSIRRDEFPFQPNYPMVVSQTPVQAAFQDQRPTTSLALANIDSPIFSRYEEDFPPISSAVEVRRGRGMKILPTPIKLAGTTPLKEAAATPVPHQIISQREELDTPDYGQIISSAREQLKTSPPHPFLDTKRGGRPIRDATPISPFGSPPSVLGKNPEKSPTGETPDLKNPKIETPKTDTRFPPPPYFIRTPDED
jgi:hypothetical protein